VLSWPRIVHALGALRLPARQLLSISFARHQVMETQVQRLSRWLRWFRERPALAMFVGLALVYLSLSPLSLLGMGYVPLFFKVSNQIIDNLEHLLGITASFTPIGTTNHGLLEPIIEVPFIWIGRLLDGNNYGPNGGPDTMLSVEPVLEVALICTVIFLWVRKITSSASWAYMLAMAAGFTTMLWAYAYISLETTQSLFLILSGYLVLADEKKGRWKTVAVGVCCGIACSVKSSGIFLIPAIAFLVFEYSRDGRSIRWRRLLLAGLICLAFLAGNRYSQMRQPGGYGLQLRPARALFYVSRTTPIMAILNVPSMFVSMNKGLLIYCPILLLSLAGLKVAYARQPRLVIFALLVLAGIVCGIGITFYWADECWGPRYLCASVAPLVVCLGAAKGHLEFNWRKQLALLGLMTWGLAVSALGGLFYYHALHVTAMKAQPLTMEDILHQVEWNPIRFDCQLLRLWVENRILGRQVDQYWPPHGHDWVLHKPDPVTPVNLRPIAVPQGYIFQPRKHWASPRQGKIKWLVCCVLLVAGVTILIGVGRQSFACRT
jgi:hypothetical protein